MKSNIDDQCAQYFKELKFNKKHRYLIYKVDNERVVLPLLSRSSRKAEKENTTGPTWSSPYPPSSPECASSIWNTPMATAWTAASCSSVTGCLTEPLSRSSCFTPLLRKTSRLIWTSEERKSYSTVLTM